MTAKIIPFPKPNDHSVRAMLEELRQARKEREQ